MPGRVYSIVKWTKPWLCLAALGRLTPGVAQPQGGPEGRAPAMTAGGREQASELSAGSTPGQKPPNTDTVPETVIEEALKKARKSIIEENAQLIERVAAIEGKSPQAVVAELSAMSAELWVPELKRRLAAEGAHWRRAKQVLTRGLFPRPASTGLLEINLTAGLDGYKWESQNPGLFDFEGKLGLRMLILPVSETNVGVYLSTEFAFPIQGVERFADSLTMRLHNGKAITDEDIQKSRIGANRVDLAGGLHARILAFGSGSYWRGIFGSIGYRGAVMGGTNYGIEAGFGVDVWKLRLGAAWYLPLAGPVQEQGGQTWGIKIEWRLIKAFDGAGL